LSEPPDRRPLALPRYRQPHERAFGLGGLDLRLAMHVKTSGGFYVEAGANDGVSQSNTLFFARYRGWRGLLVEPVPELARRCRSLRPESVVEQAAIVAPDHAEPTITMRYANLMSVVAGARGGDAEDREHVARGEELQGVSSYEVEVPARTLGAILDAHGVTRVDLLSLDLEGYEPQALRGLDLDRHRPEWILVEAWDRPAIDDLLGARYDTVAELSHHDVLYRRRRRRRRLERSRARDGDARALSRS
jgi:FkbM family methyltransferase